MTEKFPRTDTNARAAKRPPKISVCVPPFNRARFLPGAVESVLGHIFRDFEVVVADGSHHDALVRDLL